MIARERIGAIIRFQYFIGDLDPKLTTECGYVEIDVMEIKVCEGAVIDLNGRKAKVFHCKPPTRVLGVQLV